MSGSTSKELRKIVKTGKRNGIAWSYRRVKKIYTSLPSNARFSFKEYLTTEAGS